MKKSTTVLLVAVALLMGAAVGIGVRGATQDDSTVLVSLDYIESVLKPWVKEQTNGSDGSYTVVYLTKGQRLMADDALELVVRSGSANAISTTANLGLSDMTAGAEILNGAKVPVNHQVMVPRGDGR
ncbi:MAG: hypothetical protein IJ519_06005, partial [Clostridia bacterium]|nr:hypothetical protein [Clostridia bacterium]